ncbi:MAG: hypothetical protein IJD57_01655 [Candidatus Gastranaerophilales bacterium]|nr:hypothetical protein [Candidatus Gastranaerophilales bacterium]
MIPSLSRPAVSFTANEHSVRDAFNKKLQMNNEMAQKQASLSLNGGAINLNNPVPMHGQGQKLDVIA